MERRVRAAVLVKPKTIELREFPRPAIGPDDALLRIEGCGICGSNYEQYNHPFEKMHTHSFPIEQAEDAIHALAGAVPGLNPLHIAIVPGAPRVPLRATEQIA